MREFRSYTSYSVDDIGKAKAFYTQQLGLDPVTFDEAPGAVMFNTAGDTRFMLYQKEDHQPAGYTVLNFEVENIETIVDELSSKGVTFEALDGTNEHGIAEMGPTKAAWFKDPAGNWLGLFQGI